MVCATYCSQCNRGGGACVCGAGNCYCGSARRPGKRGHAGPDMGPAVDGSEHSQQIATGNETDAIANVNTRPAPAGGCCGGVSKDADALSVHSDDE
ncbi:hypothetical protein VTI28DRAFT_10034 [Corynascus sepedonium]